MAVGVGVNLAFVYSQEEGEGGGSRRAMSDRRQSAFGCGTEKEPTNVTEAGADGHPLQVFSPSPSLLALCFLCVFFPFCFVMFLYSLL